MLPGTWKVIGSAAVAGAVLAAGTVVAAGPWQGGQRSAERHLADVAAAAAAPERPVRPVWKPPAEHRAPAVLAGLVPRAAAKTGTPSDDAASDPDGSAAAPEPTEAGLRKALAGPLGDPALGTVAAAVADVSSGRVIFSAHGEQPHTPASTTKLATSTAALSLLGPAHRFTTSVVFEPHGGRLTLVGGGDPTLTAKAAKHPTGDSPASIEALAAKTAKALRARGVTRVRLRYDISRFAEPSLGVLGVNGNLARVQALTADEGRVDPTSTEAAPRVPDPAASAAADFAHDLAADGVEVSGQVAQGAASAGAARIAAVSSPPLADVVERMLTNSDNDIAETLGRQVAVAEHLPATFAGAGQAITAELRRLGDPTSGLALHDASGLDSRNAIPPELLVTLLAHAASAAHPRLRSIVTGLPVAGFSGTLTHRADGRDAGLVRAKTGTLTGVNTLAGLVPDADGRLLAFAFMSSGGTDAPDTEAALDRLAETVGDCGCTR